MADALEVPNDGMWRLDTKYFTVDVRPERGGEAGELSTIPEAAIVCIDTQRHDAWAHAKSLAEEVMEAQVRVLALVVNSFEGEDTRAQELVATAFEWAAENGFEVCRCCPAMAAIDDQFAESKDEGLKRVRSAIHSHMWPGMMVKGEAAGHLGNSETGDELLAGREGGEGEGEGEEDETGLERVLERVRQVRREGGSMSDEARREEAARIAEEIMSFMGGGDAGDDGHYSSDEEH